MTAARFQAPGFIPGALIAALDRIEAAAFNANVPPEGMREEIRAGLRQARDAARDAEAAMAASVATLNTAAGLFAQ